MILTRQIQTHFAFAIILLLASGVGLWLWIEASTVEIEEAMPVVEMQRNKGVTSDWKIYRNEQYGFEMKYPKNWSATNGDGLQGETLEIAYRTDEKICGEGVGCSYPGEIFIRGITKKSILLPHGSVLPAIFEDFVKKYNESGLENTGIIGTPTMIGGHEVVQINAPDNLTGPITALVPKITVLIDYSPDSVIWIEVNYFPADKISVSRAFDEILSTFKFTSPNAIGTSEWKTYRNEKYGFEVKYLGDWVVERENSPLCEFGPNGDNESVCINEAVSITQKDSAAWFTANEVSCQNLNRVWNIWTLSSSGSWSKPVCEKGLLLEASFFNDDSKNNIYKQILDSLLSTFKFDVTETIRPIVVDSYSYTNKDGDLTASQSCAFGIMLSWEHLPVESAYVIAYQSEGASGPWKEIEKQDLSGPATSLFYRSDGRGFYYKLEAFSKNGTTLKSYGALLVPKDAPTGGCEI